jgi:hypothetical protein
VAKRNRSSKGGASFADLSLDELAEAVSPHWQHLTQVLPSLGEADVHRLICWELANRRNKAILKRLHQRYCKLRMEREREAMMTKWEVP